MVIFLLFCAIVTPFEIAFVNHEPSHKPISIINFVDDGSKCARTDGSERRSTHAQPALGFTTDLLMNCRTGYFDLDEGAWITNPNKIFKAYLKSWCVMPVESSSRHHRGNLVGRTPRNTHDHRLDLRPALRPRFIIDFVSVIPFDYIAEFSGSDEAANLAVLRLIRLARLLKLLRVFRASRLLQKWETRIAVSASVLTVAKAFIALIVIIHW